MSPSGPSVAPTRLTDFNDNSKKEPTTTQSPIHPRIQITVIVKTAT
jgi:hypothetical protein